MAKKRKTKQQKITAEKRNKVYKVTPVEIISHKKSSYPLITEKPQVSERPQIYLKQNVTTAQYSYIYPDLIKTTIVTMSIIAVELIIAYIFL